ncbi:MAG TPA: hypothetical protein PKD37_08020 [Oligoflexia bacterium]|nr:hypothetical protein [Oligoflexia bacterium]HMP27909.1 hypothetical protein [Oligoflexia bacterium]
MIKKNLIFLVVFLITTVNQSLAEDVVCPQVLPECNGPVAVSVMGQPVTGPCAPAYHAMCAAEYANSCQNTNQNLSLLLSKAKKRILKLEKDNAKLKKLSLRRR